MRICVLLCAIGLTATVAGAQDISPFYDALSRETLPRQRRLGRVRRRHNGRVGRVARARVHRP